MAPDPGPLSYTWDQALAAVRAGVMVPRKAAPADTSATHIPDPARTAPAVPDYIPACASSGLDSSAPCLSAALLAVDNARAQEGVKPMVLPADFGRLDVAQQLLVVINLERIDRSLPPFVRCTPALDRNAQQGADIANDPPDPGDAYDVVDGIWAGGSSNALDADYGWMYDDGIGSGNLDCPERGGSGCWGHRHGTRQLRRHYLSAQFWRLARRIGKKKAAVAVGHSILVIRWYLLTDDCDYEDLGGDYFARRVDPDRARDRLVEQLQHLGYQVALRKAAA